MLRTARALLAALVVASFFAFAGGIVVEPVSHAAQPASMATLRAQAIYFQQARSASQQQIAVNAMALSSPWEADLWKGFVASWSSINNSMKMNAKVPSGLPKKGHVFVVLGSALKTSGKVGAKFKRRLELAVKALAKYPGSKVLVTGGAPKNGVTEGEAGYHWLVAEGVAKSRILVEKKASSTIGNAKYSMAILAGSSKYTSYSLISDSSHLRRASILFDAAKVLVQEQTGRAWSITREPNLAYMDMKTAGRVPLADWSVSYTASNVASLFDVSSKYKKLLASPPPRPVLTAVTVTTPAKVTYAVGEKLSTRDMVVKAVYNKGVYTTIVTDSVRISGFSSSSVGEKEATASYSDGSVTKRSSFEYTIVKASSATRVSASRTTLKRYRTRAVLKVRVTTASGVKPTGKVRFYLDGRRLKTIRMDADDRGVVTYTYPRLSKTGKRVLKAVYVGNTKLKSSRQSVTVKVA